MRKLSESTKDGLMKLGIIIAFVSLLVTYSFTQRYVQDSKNTATKGLILQKTLHLNNYSLVSDGNGIFGKYNRYTRSDRHSDVLTVYCNKYCYK